MTEPSATPTASSEPAAEAPEAWKPEPRQWTWKDLFTAPMLAFKPRCMLVSAVAVIAICLWYRFSHVLPTDPHPVISAITTWLWHSVALIIFSLAATLVAVFMKADLLDDEFLTFGEAIAAYRKRLIPALLVPVFLMGLIGGFHVLLGVVQLAFNIPIAGPLVHAVTYPVWFLLGLFVFLLSVAVALSVFVFPSIIAIRKHGWFDNVVDTFEAVGTKPHVLVASLFLVALLVGVAGWIGLSGIVQLKQTTRTLGFQPLIQTERQADNIRDFSLSQVTPKGDAGSPIQDAVASILLLATMPTTTPTVGESSAVYKITGAIAGVWQVVISALVLGYCLNLFVGGGMLTYLSVREDDYWDDEDLEDLDQLAKELEEEAKQETMKEGGVAAAAPAPTPAAPAPVAAAPVESPAVTAPTSAPDAAAPTPAAAAAPPTDKPL